MAASGLLQNNFLLVNSFMHVQNIPFLAPDRYHQQSILTIYQSAATGTGESQGDDVVFDDITNLRQEDNMDDDDDNNGSESDDSEDMPSLEKIQSSFDDYVDEGDEDYDDHEENYEVAGMATTSSKGMGYELDASVERIVQQYMKTYENFKKSESETSTSVPKMSIIQSWFGEMSGWDSDQYNQLIKEISQIGSVRDTETILYHLIPQHQQQDTDHQGGEVLVTDETFYHVFASYQYRQKLQKKNKNKKNRGIGFKVEQLLAIQDALSNRRDEVITPSKNKSNPIQPSYQTLNAVLYAMTLDRNDNKIALRAHRIWDRMLRMMDETTSKNDLDPNTAMVFANAVLSTLICCTHVPRMDATPAEKLSSFTVALECFNWATTNTAALAAQPQQQSNAYMYFLRACRILLSETSESKRDAVVEAAFRRACTNGFVDTKVVQAMEEIASDALMLRMLGGFIEDGQDLPMEWSRNCVVRSSKRVEESAV